MPPKAGDRAREAVSHGDRAGEAVQHDHPLSIPLHYQLGNHESSAEAISRAEARLEVATSGKSNDDRKEELKRLLDVELDWLVKEREAIHTAREEAVRRLPPGLLAELTGPIPVNPPPATDRLPILLHLIDALPHHLPAFSTRPKAHWHDVLEKAPWAVDHLLRSFVSPFDVPIDHPALAKVHPGSLQTGLFTTSITLSRSRAEDAVKVMEEMVTVRPAMYLTISPMLRRLREKTQEDPRADITEVVVGRNAADAVKNVRTRPLSLSTLRLAMALPMQFTEYHYTELVTPFPKRQSDTLHSQLQLGQEDLITLNPDLWPLQQLAVLATYGCNYNSGAAGRDGQFGQKVGQQVAQEVKVKVGRQVGRQVEQMGQKVGEERQGVMRPVSNVLAGQTKL